MTKLTSDNLTFIDSNILIYLFSEDKTKKEIAKSLLSSQYIISTQVVNENINVCLRKLKLTKEEAFAHGRNLLSTCTVVSIYPATIIKCMNLATKYSLGFWDSLIVSTALENNCKYLLSEDMQSGLIVNKKLEIINPFNIKQEP